MACLVYKGYVNVAVAAWYVNNPSQRRLVRGRVKLVNELMPLIKKHLIFNASVTVGFIKAKHVYGFFMLNNVRIDPRKGTVLHFIDTLCHELVHANQYFVGDLSYKFSANHGMLCSWKNSGATVITDKNYKTLPWEVDARSRAKKLVSLIKSHYTKEQLERIVHEAGSD